MPPAPGVFLLAGVSAQGREDGCELSPIFSACPSCLAGGREDPVAFSHQGTVGKNHAGLATGDLLVPLKAAKSMICPRANLA